MKVVILMLLGSLGVFAYAIGFGKGVIKDEPKIKWFLLMIFGIFLAVPCYIYGGVLCEREQPKSIHSVDFNVKSEIHVEYIDSLEVSRDTLYTFTPKK